MNVSPAITMNYEQLTTNYANKNKPNSKPIYPYRRGIKANPRKAQMNVNPLITKDYRKKDDFAVPKNKPKTNPIPEKPEWM